MRKIFKYKGLKIRKHHKNSVRNLVLSMIFLSWIIVGACYYFFFYPSFSNNNIVAIVVGVISLLLPTIAIFLFYRWSASNGGYFLRLEQRQWLGRMIIYGRMYTTQTSRRSNGSKSVTKEKIVYFPKIYYRYKKGVIYVRFPLDLQQYQDRFLKMKEPLEHAFYCDCRNVREERNYVLFELLYDPSKLRKDISNI